MVSESRNINISSGENKERPRKGTTNYKERLLSVVTWTDQLGGLKEYN